MLTLWGNKNDDELCAINWLLLVLILMPDDCKYHSTRHTFAYWAACCGAETADIQNAGRWKTTSAFSTYLEMGKNDLATKIKNNGVNPFKNIWEWQNPLPQHSDSFIRRGNQLFSGGQQSN